MALVYYRLNVIHIVVPPLREHPEDVPLLLSHFLEAFGNSQGTDTPKVSSEAVALLQAYSWMSLSGWWSDRGPES